MSAADEFPLPPGNPGALKAAGGALQDVSTDLSAMGTRIAREQAGMAAAWQGDAGAAAGAETGTLATITTDKGGRVGDGASALSDYAAALESALADVTAIRRQADQAEIDARSEAARSAQGLSYDDDRQAIYASIRSQALAPLRMHYRSVIETLDRAASTAAGRLTAAVPEYHSGMTPGQLSVAARDATALLLPSVLKEDGQDRAGEVAAQLQPLLEHGKQIPAALLAKLEADKDNPWFAKTLLETLGPQAPDWALMVMAGNGFPRDYNRRVITDFGQMLALSTRQVGDARLPGSYVRKFLAPLDQHSGIGLQYAWDLGNLLHFGGTFGTGFLQQAGDKLYALDKAGADSQMYTMVGGWMNRPLTDEMVPDDVMEAYFDAVAKDADAARVFFAGHADRLKYYLADRRTDDYLGDGGEALGKALEAATSVHDAGFRGQGSAQVTSDLVHLLGSQDHGFLAGHDRAEVLPHVADILNGYREDVYYALSRTDYGGAATTAPRLGQPELGTGGWGVEFSAADLKGTLAQVDHDSAAYRSVVKAQLSASEEFLRDKLAAARAQPLRRDDLLQAYARGHGLVLKELFDTHINTQVAMGKLADDRNLHDLRVADAVSGSLLTILPAFPPAVLPATVLSVGKAATMPFLYEGVTSDSQAAANRSASVAQVDQWYSGTLSTMVTNMQDGGGFAGTPADAGTWMSAHGVGAADRFLDGGGHLLDPAGMTDGQKAAYQQWLADPENDGVRVEMVKIFTALDAAGGQQGG